MAKPRTLAEGNINPTRRKTIAEGLTKRELEEAVRVVLALASGGGGGGGGGMPGVIYAGREPYPGKAGTRWDEDLGFVLNVMKQQAREDKIPISNIRLHGLMGSSGRR